MDCLVRLNRAAEAAVLAAEVAAEFESIGARVDAAVTHGLRSLALTRLGVMVSPLTCSSMLRVWPPPPTFVAIRNAPAARKTTTVTARISNRETLNVPVLGN